MGIWQKSLWKYMTRVHLQMKKKILTITVYLDGNLKFNI